MTIRLPGLPRPGDRVALLAPSSPLRDQADLPRCIGAIGALGFDVKPYPTLERRDGYMAGTPAERASDLGDAFRDGEISAIFSLRGGFSAAHVLPLLDWEALRSSTRLFCGFSDLTALLVPLAIRSQLASLHAPTASYFLRRRKGIATARRALQRLLFHPWEGLSYREMCGSDFQPRMITPGSARGRILGGNLSVLASLMGTPWVEGLDAPILLFLEDVDERPFRLDRYLTQILQSPLRNWVAGVLLGQFTGCADPGGQTAADVMERLLTPLGVPILSGIPIGHGVPSFPLPIGAEALLDGETGDLILLGVR